MNKKLFLTFLIIIGILLVPALACAVSFDDGQQVPIVITVIVPQEPTLPPPPTPRPPVQTAMESEPPTERPTERPTFTASRDLSCAEGPDWRLYWFVLKYNAFDTAPVIGKNGEYLLVDYKGYQCWVWGKKGEINGSLSSVPFVKAPPLPQIKLIVWNGLDVEVYLIVYDWYTGERVGTLGFVAPGKSGKIKLQSGYYSILGYNRGDQKIFQSDMINLAVGDGDHIQTLADGTVEITIVP